MTRYEIVNSSRGWTIDGFRAFWAKPDISMVPAIRNRITSDIIGHGQGRSATSAIPTSISG